jgi:hypothetical protein
VSSARRAADRRATSALAVVVPAALAASLAVLIAGPHRTVIEFDDLREGQLEAAGAVVLTLIGGVSLGRTRRDRSRRSLLIGLGLLGMAVTGLFASIAIPLADALARSTFATWTTVGGCAFGALLLLAATLLPERAVPHGRGAVALALAARACTPRRISPGEPSRCAGWPRHGVRWGSRGRSGRRPPAGPSAARPGGRAALRRHLARRRRCRQRLRDPGR